MTITIAVVITGVFGGVGGEPSTSVSSLSEHEETLKKWLNKLSDALKRLAGKVVEALHAILGSPFGAILSFWMFHVRNDLLLNMHWLYFCSKVYWGIVDHSLNPSHL